MDAECLADMEAATSASQMVLATPYYIEISKCEDLARLKRGLHILIRLVASDKLKGATYHAFEDEYLNSKIDAFTERIKELLNGDH